jgi:hypothetical protein
VFQQYVKRQCQVANSQWAQGRAVTAAGLCKKPTKPRASNPSTMSPYEHIQMLERDLRLSGAQLPGGRKVKMVAMLAASQALSEVSRG